MFSEKRHYKDPVGNTASKPRKAFKFFQGQCNAEKYFFLVYFFAYFSEFSFVAECRHFCIGAVLKKIGIWLTDPIAILFYCNFKKLFIHFLLPTIISIEFSQTLLNSILFVSTTACFRRNNFLWLLASSANSLRPRRKLPSKLGKLTTFTCSEQISILPQMRTFIISLLRAYDDSLAPSSTDAGERDALVVSTSKYTKENST